METKAEKIKLPSWAINLRAMVKMAGSPHVFAKRLHDTAVKFHRPALSTKDLTDLVLSAMRGKAEAMNALMRGYNVYPFMTSFQKVDTDDITKRPRWASREMWKAIVNAAFPRIVEPQKRAV